MATKRKAISKKVRFEVFKRDSFTCQYCGRSAPEVVLHIEHIKPVIEGGDNDILNLITACSDCNYGKGKRLLSDDSVIAKTKRQLDEINERRVQLELLLQWRNELELQLEKEVQVAGDLILKNATKYGVKGDYALSEYSLSNIRKIIKTFGFIEVLDAIEIAKDQYDNEATLVLDRLGGICYNRRKEKEERVKRYGNQTSC